MISVSVSHSLSFSLHHVDALLPSNINQAKFAFFVVVVAIAVVIAAASAVKVRNVPRALIKN